MVEQIRDLSASLAYAVDSYKVVGPDNFTSQLFIASQVSSHDALSVMNTASYSVIAMGLVAANGTMPATVQDPATNTTSTIFGIGIPVTATKTATGYSLAVNAVVQGNTVNLSADLTNNAYDTIQAAKQHDQTLTMAEAQFVLSGTVANSGVELSLGEGSSASIAGEVDNSISGQSTLDITATALDFNVILKQQASVTVTNPVTFTGKILADINNVDVQVTNTTVTSSIGQATLTLDGTFADIQDHYYKAVLVVHTDGSQATGSDILSFSLTLTGTIPGFSPATEVVITGDRQTFVDFSGSVEFLYDGKTLSATTAIDSTTGNRTVTIVNQDNAHLVLELKANGQVTGIITVDGQKYADIVRVSNGIQTTYADDTSTLN